jgi:hypothetical protein
METSVRRSGRIVANVTFLLGVETVCGVLIFVDLRKTRYINLCMCYSVNNKTLLQHLQQAGGHAFSRTLHAQLFHYCSQQQALDTGSRFNITLPDHSFGALK